VVVAQALAELRVAKAGQLVMAVVALAALAVIMEALAANTAYFVVSLAVVPLLLLMAL
jgi:hypothetical protein